MFHDLLTFKIYFIRFQLLFPRVESSLETFGLRILTDILWFRYELVEAFSTELQGQDILVDLYYITLDQWL